MQTDRSDTTDNDPAALLVNRERERWQAECGASRPHAGEMFTYLKGLLREPSHPGIRRCAKKLIDQIEEAARAT